MKNRKLRLCVVTTAIFAVLGINSATAADTLEVKPTINSTTSTPMPTSRIIVKYKNNATTQSTKLNLVQNAATRASVLQTAANGRSPAAPLTANHLRQMSVGADVIRVSRALNNAEMQKLITELMADPNVEYAEPDTMMQHTGMASPQAATPDDPLFTQYQWHMQKNAGGIDVLSAWDKSEGEGVVVAVIDSGILPAHPDAPINLLQGYDFITDAEVSGRPTNERVPGALDYGDWVAANECGNNNPKKDSSFHGSHVAGTIAEATRNKIGMVGVAPKATILPIRALGHCGGYTSDITDAIVWASGGDVPGVPKNQNPANVINMSLGGSGSCGARQVAIDGAVSRGTVVVTSAGNANVNASNNAPANCNNIITVGATGVTGAKASYSNFGNIVDLSAPGGGGGSSDDGYVWQMGSSSKTTPDQGAYTYMGMAGTSMASPHVAATVALVQSALVAAGKTPLAQNDMEALLKKTARPFPVNIPTNTPMGAGIVDPTAAIEEALKESCTENCGITATPLINKNPISNLTGSAGKETVYSFEAQAGKVLSIMSYGGSGTVGLYVSFDKEPTATEYDAKSTNTGTNQTVRFTAPKAGKYYIKMIGGTNYKGLTVEVRQ